MRTLLLVASVSVTAHAEPPVFIEDRPIIDPRDDGTERYLTLGVLSGPVGGMFGLRAQIDAIGALGFTIGAAGTLFGRGVQVVDDMPMVSATGVGFLAFTTPVFHTFRVRGQLGYGALYRVEQDATTMMATTTQARLVEAALLVTARANHDWSVVGGPIYQRTLDTMPDAQWLITVGLQRRF